MRDIILKEIRAISRSRNIPASAVQLVAERGHLKSDIVSGYPSYVVTDNSAELQQSRRLDNQLYPQYNKLRSRKAHTLKGSNQKWLMGSKESEKYNELIFAEGSADFIAAHALIKDQTQGVIAMLGSSSGIDERCLQYVRGKRIRFFPHLDEAGKKASIRWARQLASIGCIVDAYDFSGLVQRDGKPVTDLNEFLNITDKDIIREARL